MLRSGRWFAPGQFRVSLLAVAANRGRAVMPCTKRWGGANPMAPAPSLRFAVVRLELADRRQHLGGVAIHLHLGEDLTDFALLVDHVGHAAGHTPLVLDAKLVRQLGAFVREDREIGPAVHGVLLLLGAWIHAEANELGIE